MTVGHRIIISADSLETLPSTTMLKMGLWHWFDYSTLSIPSPFWILANFSHLTQRSNFSLEVIGSKSIKTQFLCFWSLQGARNDLFYTTIYKNCSKFKSFKTHFRIRLERKPIRDIFDSCKCIFYIHKIFLSSASSIKKSSDNWYSFLVSANQLASDVWPSRRVGNYSIHITRKSNSVQVLTFDFHFIKLVL